MKRKVNKNNNPMYKRAWRVYSWDGEIGHCDIYPNNKFFELNISRDRELARLDEIEERREIEATRERLREMMRYDKD